MILPLVTIALTNFSVGFFATFLPRAVLAWAELGKAEEEEPLATVQDINNLRQDIQRLRHEIRVRD